MEIYLIRHGETAMNAKFSHQKPTEPLDQKGREQATEVAKRLSEFKIDTICSSPFARAKETAEIIAARLDLSLNYLPEMVEIGRPTFLYKHSYFSFATIRYLWLLFKNKQVKNLNCDEAESLWEISQRAKAAGQALAKTKGHRVAVISHAMFMNIFVSLICHGHKLNRKRFIHHLYQTMRTKNTTIFHLHYNQEQNPSWQLIKKLDQP